MYYRKLRLADAARVLGWSHGTVRHYIDANPERLHKYISEWGRDLLISEKALPVLRGLREEKHGDKENFYA